LSNEAFAEAANEEERETNAANREAAESNRAFVDEYNQGAVRSVDTEKQAIAVLQDLIRRGGARIQGKRVVPPPTIVEKRPQPRPSSDAAPSSQQLKQMSECVASLRKIIRAARTEDNPAPPEGATPAEVATWNAHVKAAPGQCVTTLTRAVHVFDVRLYTGDEEWAEPLVAQGLLARLVDCMRYFPQRSTLLLRCVRALTHFASRPAFMVAAVEADAIGIVTRLLPLHASPQFAAAAYKEASSPERALLIASVSFLGKLAVNGYIRVLVHLDGSLQALLRVALHPFAQLAAKTSFDVCDAVAFALSNIAIGNAACAQCMVVNEAPAFSALMNAALLPPAIASLQCCNSMLSLFANVTMAGDTQRLALWRVGALRYLTAVIKHHYPLATAGHLSKTFPGVVTAALTTLGSLCLSPAVVFDALGDAQVLERSKTNSCALLTLIRYCVASPHTADEPAAATDMPVAGVGECVAADVQTLALQLFSVVCAHASTRQLLAVVKVGTLMPAVVHCVYAAPTHVGLVTTLCQVVTTLAVEVSGEQLTERTPWTVEGVIAGDGQMADLGFNRMVRKWDDGRHGLTISRLSELNASHLNSHRRSQVVSSAVAAHQGGTGTHLEQSETRRETARKSLMRDVRASLDMHALPGFEEEKVCPAAPLLRPLLRLLAVPSQDKKAVAAALRALLRVSGVRSMYQKLVEEKTHVALATLLSTRKKLKESSVVAALDVLRELACGSNLGMDTELHVLALAAAGGGDAMPIAPEPDSPDYAAWVASQASLHLSAVMTTKASPLCETLNAVMNTYKSKEKVMVSMCRLLAELGGESALASERVVRMNIQTCLMHVSRFANVPDVVEAFAPVCSVLVASHPANVKILLKTAAPLLLTKLVKAHIMSKRVVPQLLTAMLMSLMNMMEAEVKLNLDPLVVTTQIKETVMEKLVRAVLNNEKAGERKTTTDDIRAAGVGAPAPGRKQKLLMHCCDIFLAQLNGTRLDKSASQFLALSDGEKQDYFATKFKVPTLEALTKIFLVRGQNLTKYHKASAPSTRYLYVSPSATFLHWRDPKKPTGKVGSLPLRLITSVEVGTVSDVLQRTYFKSSRNAKSDLCFCITGVDEAKGLDEYGNYPSKTHNFGCASEVDRDKWVKHLQVAIDYRREVEQIRSNLTSAEDAAYHDAKEESSMHMRSAGGDLSAASKGSPKSKTRSSFTGRLSGIASNLMRKVV
jgi:hypothetical protein